MSEITIHTGSPGSHAGINIDWFDENNVRHIERLAIMVEEQDKPRMLVITINGEIVARFTSSKRVTIVSTPEDPEKL